MSLEMLQDWAPVTGAGSMWKGYTGWEPLWVLGQSLDMISSQQLLVQTSLTLDPGNPGMMTTSIDQVKKTWGWVETTNPILPSFHMLCCSWKRP